jgi:acyl carrier protein
MIMERVIQLISQVGGIGSVGPDAGIYEAGFSSVRVLELLLALEDEFGISIPDKDFMAARSPRQISELIERLREKEMA